MIHCLRNLNGFSIFASDGEIGKVEDCYFDDEKWTVRYLVVRTGSWLFGKEVLLSPIVVERLDFENSDIICTITAEQVKNSPSVETEKPISKQQEQEFSRYFGYPVYWGGAGIWGNTASPSALIQTGDEIGMAEQNKKYDHHLRSVREVTGYRIHTSDCAVGHVENFFVDDDEWTVRYLEVHIPGIRHGKKVIITPSHVLEVDWAQAEVAVDLSKETVENAPVYEEGTPITREYEARLLSYYNESPYWD